MHIVMQYIFYYIFQFENVLFSQIQNKTID